MKIWYEDDRLHMFSDGEGPGRMLADLLDYDTSLFFALRAVKEVKSKVGQHTGAALCLLAQQYQDGKIANIGTFQGYSAAIMARRVPDTILLTIDPYPTPWAKHEKPARRNLGKYKNVRMIKAYSWDYLYNHPNSEWDMVFVDGAHKDILLDMPWFNQMKAGGLFISHDYIPDQFPMVYDAMNGLRDRLERPFDVYMMDDRGKGRGTVGFYRKDGEHWTTP